MDRIIVYGLGKYFEDNIEYLRKTYDIVGYYDKNRRGVIFGKQIRSIEEISDVEESIVIMIENMYYALEAARDINSLGIDASRIIMGLNIIHKNNAYEKDIEEIYFSKEGNISLTIKGFNCELISAEEYYDVYSVLIHEDYAYYINNEKKDIVFDVGMNIGDSAHYFLSLDNVEKVYSYEPFFETYERGIINLSNDIERNADRFEGFNYGLSDKSERRTVIYNSGMTVGMSTDPEFHDIAEEKYIENGRISIDDNSREEIEVKCASIEIKEKIEKHNNNNIVMKLDCEGEEYAIISELKRTGLLKKIDLIMMEWHYQGCEILIESLVECGFSYCRFDKSECLGMIYAYK